MSDYPTMNVEFLCGHVAHDIGLVSLATKSHYNSCTDADCKADLEKSRYLNLPTTPTTKDATND